MNPVSQVVRALVLCGAIAGGVPALAAAPVSCDATSPAHRVAVVELFTSEGCSSCPPADRWLSSLEGAGFGTDRVLGLALHVGYWDYIGWKDPYAQPGFTDRQRAYARLFGARSIYTPQVVLDGRDYRAWSNRAAFERYVAAVNAQPAPVRLALRSVREQRTLSISVEALREPQQQAAQPAKLQIAVFENGLSNRVTRGENAGSTLGHDRVVRHWLGPFALSGASSTIDARVELAPDIDVSRAGIAAFAQREDGAMLQAVACALR